MFNLLNERMKGLTVFDISLVKLSVFFATIVVAKLFPKLLHMNYPVLIVLVLAFSAKPLYDFWFRK